MISRAIITVTAFLLLWMAQSVFATTPIQVHVNVGAGGDLALNAQVESVQEAKQKNVIYQQHDYSCGAASLATIFNFYLGVPVPEGEIVETILRTSPNLLAIIQRKGFSLLDLKRFAESRKFHVVGYRLDFEDLVNLGVPAIVPIIPLGFKHFVVFRGADKERVYLADPARGNITEPIYQFKEEWYGFQNVAMVINPREGTKAEYEMKVSEMDEVFIKSDSSNDLLSRTAPFIPYNPGMF
jgi:uncharacterized protein